MRAGTEPATDDQVYLDQLFDHIVELIEDGRPVGDLALDEGREHLRAQVDRLIRLAQGVALGRSDPLPRIAGYTILSELGRGGMGIVYLAQQEKLGGRLVALKLILDGAWASGKQRRRFEREAELVAALRHPNIVRLYDSGLTEDRFPYYVMEYVEGTSLQDWSSAPTAAVGAPADTSPPNRISDRLPADSSSVSARDAAELVAKISEAVGYAHQRGTIHRDLKPSNILVDPADEPHVLDFGLAKLVSDKEAGGSSARMSQTGEFMGSLPWASPEQAEGALDRIDVRTDVYSLGVMAFHLLTGRFPYAVTGSFGQVLDNIQHAEPPHPSKLRPGLDDEIDTIVLKCLAKEPDRRYQTAGELARDLRRYLAGEPIEAKRDSMAYMLRKQLRRYRVRRVGGCPAGDSHLHSHGGVGFIRAPGHARARRGPTSGGVGPGHQRVHARNAGLTRSVRPPVRGRRIARRHGGRGARHRIREGRNRVRGQTAHRGRHPGHPGRDLPAPQSAELGGHPPHPGARVAPGVSRGGSRRHADFTWPLGRAARGPGRVGGSRSPLAADVGKAGANCSGTTTRIR